MHVASLELCRTLHELSGWENTRDTWRLTDGNQWYINTTGESNIISMEYAIPAYDLGYLLRKLPVTLQSSEEMKWAALAMWHVEDWFVGYPGITYAHDEVMEDAACKLAIELFKQGILTKQQSASDEEEGKE